jgi:hypothetical protein
MSFKDFRVRRPTTVGIADVSEIFRARHPRGFVSPEGADQHRPPPATVNGRWRLGSPAAVHCSCNQNQRGAAAKSRSLDHGARRFPLTLTQRQGCTLLS